MAKLIAATSSQPHPVHQLSCYEVATGIVLWHCKVQEKENEINALKPLLIPPLVKGRIFTLDAMHTQRALCAQIQRLEGEYVLIAKDNQPTLHEDSADLFEDRSPDRRRWKQAETWDKAHGRLEHRQITCSPDLNDWFAKDWQGIEQVFRLERKARLLKTNQTRHEVVYGLSSSITDREEGTLMRVPEKFRNFSGTFHNLTSIKELCIMRYVKVDVVKWLP